MGMDRKTMESVLEAVANGSPIRLAVESHGSSMHSFYGALKNDIELQKLYAWAREVRAETMAEEVVEIADNEPDAAKARNRMDARRWYASKMKPEKYGDKIDVNVHQSVDLLTAIDEAKKRAIPVPFRPIVQELDFKPAEPVEDNKQDGLNIFE